MAIGTGIGALAVAIIVVVFLIIRFKPSTAHADVSKYYDIPDGEAMILFENSVYEKNALVSDGEVYVDLDTVIKLFDERYYWDSAENLVIYTTSTDLIKASVGSSDYTVNKSRKTMNAPIVRTEGDTPYISLSFVKQYSNIDYQYFESPNRVMIQYQWGKQFLTASVKKDTQLRTDASVKSEILEDVKSGTTVTYLGDGTIEGKFAEVITSDGLTGYIRMSALNKAEQTSKTSDYVSEKYSSLTSETPLNLVWHQVSNQDANNNLLNLISSTKGVNTISPTWFEVSDENGSISSLASETYVSRAHNAGLAVWGLCDDFNKNVAITTVLAKTTSREKLENELVAAALKYSLDGINIDFETIPSDGALAYVEFVRELSIKCRNNGIVLSIDTYVPTSYSKYYDRTELGVVADYVIIMSYDEHTAGSEEAGSVSSISFVQQAIDDSLEMIPANKLVIGIPFYTRLWQVETGSDGTEKVVDSVVYSMKNTQNLLSDEKVTTKWDETTQQNYAEYQSGGKNYKIWVEDAKSIEAKMKAIYNGGCGGVAEWRLGFETKDVWNVIQKYAN